MNTKIINALVKFYEADVKGTPEARNNAANNVIAEIESEYPREALLAFKDAMKPAEKKITWEDVKG